ncbi:MAG: SDR family NAD(P)-dependent oxidoreductase, partial [Eubacteriales bacterium]|nr:SDR family NAD(P)-dependent oxidoreductase [Eubacteriales bacterium]
KNVAAIISEFEKIDILITAAGGSARQRIKPLVDQSVEVIEEIIGVNLMGTLYFARAVAARMIARGYGRIVFIGSIVGTQGSIGLAEYSAAKGGVVAMAKSLAMELGGYGITVNCVSPGLIRRPDEMDRDGSHTNYLKGNNSAGMLASTIAFLSSDEASFTTGQNYIVDGGRSLGLKGSR